MFLGNRYWLLLQRARLLLPGHLWDGLGCLHFNLAFICVVSSKDSCYNAERASSGLCLDKVNKWSSTLASRVGMSKVKGSELQAAKLGLRTPCAQFSSIWLLPNHVYENMDKQPRRSSLLNVRNLKVNIQAIQSPSTSNASTEQLGLIQTVCR